MPKPNIIESITVPDAVMYNETSCRISWTAASGDGGGLLCEKGAALWGCS